MTAALLTSADALRAERVVDAHQTLGESPFWSSRERALWFVDLRAPAVLRFDAGTGKLSLFPMDALCGGVVASARGGLLVALATGVHRFDPVNGGRALLLAPEPPDAGNRLNETKADRRGRLWTSSMRDFGAAVAGSLYRVTPPATVTRVLADICIPNALAWSPDARTTYFADTRDGRIRAYACDPDTGELGAMRILVDKDALPGGPDGAIVDADGCVWSARYGGGCVARITPAGRVDRIVHVPVTNVTSCALGDADLRTLYITTARQRMTPTDLQREPDAGALFAARVPVPGLPEPECVL